MNKNNIAIDYLRALITILVLAHHSVIAYAGFVPSATASLTSKPYFWAPFPVVDSQRWQGFDVLVLFNDTFFMSLMFLLAGLFVWPSIARKGNKDYLLGRVLRLGLPFVVCAAIISPLAYYPSYLTREADPAIAAYFQQLFALDFWPSGPAWFVAVLLGLDLLAVLLHKYLPGLIETLSRYGAGAVHRPAWFFLGFICISIIAYSTMRLTFGTVRWFLFGPFAIQAGRVLLYPTYFFAGVGLGAWGIERGLLAHDGQLARGWARWLIAACIGFALLLFFVVKIMALGEASSMAWSGMASVVFVLSGGATSFFLLAVFVRFANRRTAILDSLSANAYGMYLVHYAFVTWAQFELLDTKLSAIEKGLTVFVVTLLFSWATVAGIRLIPFVGRILSGGARSIGVGHA